MKIDLRVEIPIKFKKTLDYRFNPKNAERNSEGYSISMPCFLCKEFRNERKCGKCPFIKFKESNTEEVGCWIWINKLIENTHLYPMPDRVFWNISSNKLACEELLKLREKAQELITWIEEK